MMESQIYMKIVRLLYYLPMERMKKKEKKSDLEQLLNSLIEKGWKPRWYKNIIRLNWCDWYIISMEDENRSIEIDKSIRDLTAKESWLWQFVCENMLINKKWFYWDEYCIAEHCEYTPKYYKFRLIESALKDESELEDFLLQNIKLDGE